MSERRAFRRSGGPGSKLDVHRLVELQLRAELAQFIALAGSSRLEQAGKIQHSRRRLAAQAHDEAQLRQVSGPQFTRRTVGQLRSQLREDADVVARLEARGEHQRLAVDLVQHIFDLAAAIGRIDGRQNQARFGRSELHQQPLGAVGRPDPDTIATIEPETDQAASHTIDPLSQILPRPSYALMANDEGFAERCSRRGAIEKCADGCADQRHGGGATDVAQRVIHARSSSG